MNFSTNSTTAIPLVSTTTTSALPFNDTLFNLLAKVFNVTLYQHQTADLIEPEKFATRDIHIVIWTLSVITYLLAIPVSVRIVRTQAYLNVIDYFSFHIVLCSFIAWIPSLVLILYHWFQSFTLRLCRLHYVILSTNETVPLLFILYMIAERFLYVYPSLKYRCKKFSQMTFIHLYAIFTWLLIMLLYALASPFAEKNNSVISIYTNKYCPYNYSKLRTIAAARSIIYFCLFVPSIIIIGCILRYFYIMRGTNQIQTIQKLWTIRVTLLLSVVVVYDIYLYYLENVVETYKSFLTGSILRSTFFLIQLILIACTDLYWLEILFERCGCLCYMFMGRRRTATTPVAMVTETEIDTLPSSHSMTHYSLVDSTVNDEFDRVTDDGPEPTLRVVT